MNIHVQDMSSEKSSEEDLDAMLAALTPVHSTRGGSAKDNINVVKKDQEQQLKKEDKTMEDPPVNNTKVMNILLSMSLTYSNI